MGKGDVWGFISLMAIPVRLVLYIRFLIQCLRPRFLRSYYPENLCRYGYVT